MTGRRQEWIEALRRAAQWNQTEANIAHYNLQDGQDAKLQQIHDEYSKDASLLRTLAAALEKAQEGWWYPGEHGTMTARQHSIADRPCLILPLTDNGADE